MAYPNHLLLDRLGSHWDQSADAFAPHLARLAFVRAPKSTGHSAPGASSLALAGKANLTPPAYKLAFFFYDCKLDEPRQ